MKTLTLMRHAKSAWDAPDIDDHDRPLNARGQRAATALGHWMADHWPALALVSSATRTQQTWARLQAPKTCRVAFRSALYLATPGEILKEIQDVTDADSLLILGHNPGIGALAGGLAKAPAPHPDFQRYPTGATTVLRFDIPSWAEIQPGSGRLDAFVTPRDLEAG